MNQDHLTHRAYLKAAIALMLMAALPLLAEAAPSLPDKPNIILIMADDLGYECIGANGGTAYKTPVLDGLAKTGMRFEHCYSQPLCTPSRVQIMTGMYNVRNYVSFRSSRSQANHLRPPGQECRLRHLHRRQVATRKGPGCRPALWLRPILPVAAHARRPLPGGRQEDRPPLRESAA